MELADGVMRRLRFDNATRELLLKLIQSHDVPLIPDAKHVKRALIRYGEEGLRALLEIQRCDRTAHAEEFSDLPPYHAQIPEIVEQILAENACLSLKTLAISGNDLIRLGYKPGRELGDALQRLLDAVIDGEIPNDREALLEQANKLLESK